MSQTVKRSCSWRETQKSQHKLLNNKNNYHKTQVMFTTWTTTFSLRTGSSNKVKQAQASQQASEHSNTDIKTIAELVSILLVLVSVSPYVFSGPYASKCPFLCPFSLLHAHFPPSLHDIPALYTAFVGLLSCSIHADICDQPL